MGLGDRFGASEFVHKMPAGDWRVRNYEGSGSGTLDLIEGTAKSVNAVYARPVSYTHLTLPTKA